MTGHPQQSDDDVADGTTAISFRETVTMPLLLSLIAGLSTCLGAAVVFCAAFQRPAPEHSKNNLNKSRSSSRPSSPPLGHHHMAFALSLAGSVMCTVSIASILPESFAQDERKPSDERQDDNEEWQQQQQQHTYQLLAFGSQEFVERCGSFLIGCILYVLLSKCAFPEPDDILGFDDVVHEGHEMEIGDLSSDIVPVSNTKRKQYESVAFQRKRSQQLQQRDESNWCDEPENNHHNNDADTASSSLTSTLLPISSRSSDGDNDNNNKNQEVRKSQTFCCCITLSWSGSDLASPEARRAWRVAMLLFVSLAVHNFPEGLAVAASTLHSQSLGITTTVAIALHNIPEGVAIAVPCLAARPDAPFLAFALASLSGLAEPLGAAVALLVLSPPPDALKSGGGKASGASTPSDSPSPFWEMKNVLAFVAGIMIMVAVRELFPEAMRHSKDSKSALVAGTISGMVVMLVSDAVLEA